MLKGTLLTAAIGVLIVVALQPGLGQSKSETKPAEVNENALAPVPRILAWGTVIVDNDNPRLVPNLGAGIQSVNRGPNGSIVVTLKTPVPQNYLVQLTSALPETWIERQVDNDVTIKCATSNGGHDSGYFFHIVCLH